MKKGLFGITILNIEDIRDFLQVVDACEEPVYCMEGDRLCDLRSDADRAEVLVQMSEDGVIARLNVHTCNQRDTERMINYMMCRKRTA